MKQNSFWGTAQSPGKHLGMIVRISLALVAMGGSIALAWVLLGGHFGARAANLPNTSTNTNPWAIVFDGNGNAWVAEPGCNPAPTCAPNSGVLPTGAIQEFSFSNGNITTVKTYQPANVQTFEPTFLQLDGSGNVWFTDPTNNAIGKLVPGSNTWTEYTTGMTANAEPFGMVMVSGNIWFAERGINKIGFFNTSTNQTTQENAVPTAGSQPFGLYYTGSKIWFTEDNAPKVASFTPGANGAITGSIAEVNATSPTGPNPHMITADKSGNIWYTLQGSDQVGELVGGAGTPKTYSVAGNICPTPGVTPTPCSATFINGITTDSNGLVWFDEVQKALVFSLNPTSGAISVYSLQGGSGPGEGIAADSQNNIWVSTLYSKQVTVIASGSAPTPTPTTPSGSPTITPSVSPTPTLPAGPVSSSWYFAEGRAGGGFQEWLSVDNPSSVACQVSIQYLYTPDRGASQTKTINTTIGATTRLSENVDQDLATSPTGIGIDVSTIVSVTNTPTCAGVVAERPMYFSNTFGVYSGHDALGATHLGKTFYFADVSSAPGYRSFLTILNPPGGSLATISVTYYSGGVALGTQDGAKVAAGARGTISVHSFGAHVAAIVTSDQPVAVDRPEYFYKINGGNAGIVSGAATVTGAQALASDWLFAEGYTGGKFQEYFVIANLDTTAKATANVTVTLESSTGVATPITLSVPSLSTLTWSVNGAAPGQSVSAEITSANARIVVERQMFFQYNHVANGRTLVSTGGTDVMGQIGPAQSSSYSFAEGYVNVGYDEWLTLQNPTASTETIWVTIVNGQGKPVSFANTVGAHSRFTLDLVHAVLQSLCKPGAPSSCWEISMTVQTLNNGVFVAERPMYFNTTGRQGGTDIIGYVGG